MGEAHALAGDGGLRHRGSVSVVKVLAVDDQPVFRRVARQLVQSTEGFELVAYGLNQVRREWERLRPN